MQKRRLLDPSPHYTAAGLYFLLIGLSPVLFMALFGCGQMVAWAASGARHPWGAQCVPFFLFPAVPWLMVTALLGIVVLAASSLFGVLRRRIGIPVWVPVMVAFPVALSVVRLLRLGGMVLALVVWAGFTVYWLVFSFEREMLARGRGRAVAGVCLAVVVLWAGMLSAVLASYRESRRVADNEFGGAGCGGYRLVRASFMVKRDIRRTLWCRPCWGFLYENPTVRRRAVRIYVGLPEFEVFEFSTALRQPPFFGVIP